jgi:hypothetical protein
MVETSVPVVCLWKNAADRRMGLAELRLALGVTEALLNEALWLLSFPGDKRIEFTAKDRVALGAGWRGRCERPSDDRPLYGSRRWV